tara:strand:- start:273 stop:851 length:579 start_codon:yes stop_codon:yes gene_type:complete
MDTKVAEIMEQIPRADYLKEVQKRKDIETEALSLEKLQKEKEYNEKISDTIFGTGLKPAVVGKVNHENPHMDYDFVSFDNVVKKDPLEYITPSAVDYDVVNKGKVVPQSFFMIKDGEIDKGKDWYLNYDPKLPEEIAEMMARYNWGDLKYMTKKSAKNQRKKMNRKGKDLGVEMGFTARRVDKNNPIIVTFD